MGVTLCLLNKKKLHFLRYKLKCRRKIKNKNKSNNKVQILILISNVFEVNTNLISNFLANTNKFNKFIHYSNKKKSNGYMTIEPYFVVKFFQPSKVFCLSTS